MLKVGGIWVSPAEVENTVLAHPAVLECAVVGATDTDGLTKPKAFVVLRSGVASSHETAREIQAFVKANIAPFKLTRGGLRSSPTSSRLRRGRSSGSGCDDQSMTAALKHRRAARLADQGLPGRRRPADVVTWLGAVQAQEYAPASWGLALRMQDGGRGHRRAGVLEGRILRTHVMRPTWHFVAPADIRWLLELTAHRVHRVMAPYNRQLGLDTATLYARDRRDRAGAGRRPPSHARRAGRCTAGRGPDARSHTACAHGDARRASRASFAAAATRRQVHACPRRRARARGSPPVT